MNPCPCGYLGDPEKSCICNAGTIERYRSKLSGPLLDRIDIFLNVPRIKVQDFEKKEKSEQSAEIRSRVERARKRQEVRFAGTLRWYNSEMTNKEIEVYCVLTPEADEFLKKAVERLSLSTRVYFRILRLARTIADIEDSDDILLPHVAEALGYRQ